MSWKIENTLLRINRDLDVLADIKSKDLPKTHVLVVDTRAVIYCGSFVLFPCVSTHFPSAYLITEIPSFRPGLQRSLYPVFMGKAMARAEY